MIHAILKAAQALLVPVAGVIAMVVLLPLLAGYILLIKRKIIADRPEQQDQPERPLAPSASARRLLQPFEDVWALALQPDAPPRHADKLLFWLAPMLAAAIALLACSAIPFGPAFPMADLNVGVLFILAVASLGIYVILLGGASASNHDSLGALRGAARYLSYGMVAALALASALMLAGSLSLRQIVQAQYDQGTWFILYAPIGFFAYLAASIVQVRHPSGDPGSGAGFLRALGILAEYANMIVFAGLATTLFFGGWLRPFARFHDHFLSTPVEMLDALPALLFLALAFYGASAAPQQRSQAHKIAIGSGAGLCVLLAAVMAASLFAAPGVMAAVHGAFWFLAKALACLYGFVWLRFTFPLYRFDRLMRAAWQFLIPLTLANLIGVGIAIVLREQLGVNPFFPSLVMTVATAGVAAWLWGGRNERGARQSAPQAADGGW